jgi:hypothetical protein
LLSFHRFQLKYHKVYDENSLKTEEEAMETFFENLEKIEAHNRQGNSTFSLGLSEHSDLTFAEMKRFKTGAKRSARFKRSAASGPFDFYRISNFTAPKEGEL